jgi:hypothetical protein
MILLTPELRECLLANGRRRGLDHVPIVKFFNPLGIGLGSRPSSTRMAIHCSGSPTLENPSSDRSGLAEMQALELPLGMGIERDILFSGEYPLSVYAQAARAAGRIVTDGRSLRAAAAALQREG